MGKLIKEEKTYETSFWPFYYNGEILMIVKEKGGDEKFLNSFEFLLNYPKEANIGDIDKAIEVLQDLEPKYNPRVEKIFDKLIDRNSSYYESKENWKRKINK